MVYTNTTRGKVMSGGGTTVGGTPEDELHHRTSVENVVDPKSLKAAIEEVCDCRCGWVTLRIRMQEKDFKYVPEILEGHGYTQANGFNMDPMKAYKSNQELKKTYKCSDLRSGAITAP